MRVIDFELINNVELLRMKKIIIYGAGVYGEKVCNFIKRIYIFPDRFLDKNTNIHSFCNLECDTLEWLIGKRLEEYLIVIASDKYLGEMIGDLNKLDIDCDTCTWVGLAAAIEYNYREILDEDTYKEYLLRKNIWLHSRELETKAITLSKLSLSTQPILVYQVGKVRSASIYHALKKSGKEAIHFHRITQDSFKEIDGEKVRISVIDSDTKQLLDCLKSKELKIVTMVRDPIAQAFSNYMQGFSSGEMYCSRTINANLMDDIYCYIRNMLKSNVVFEWYNYEMEKTIGVDVYKEEFDIRKGYGKIVKDNIQILLLVMEKMDDNMDQIREFVQDEYLISEEVNVGNQKSYKYIYDELKKRIQFERCELEEFYYGNAKMRHFYDDEMIESFIAKWARQ